MNSSDFMKMCSELVNCLKSFAPYDTGNLANNGIRYEFIDKGNTCKIYVDEKIAPYMPFTNEKWISPKWNGKKNPNEGWWQKTIEGNIIPEILALTGGNLE